MYARPKILLRLIADTAKPVHRVGWIDKRGVMLTTLQSAPESEKQDAPSFKGQLSQGLLSKAVRTRSITKSPELNHFM